MTSRVPQVVLRLAVQSLLASDVSVVSGVTGVRGVNGASASAVK